MLEGVHCRAGFEAIFSATRPTLPKTGRRLAELRKGTDGEVTAVDGRTKCEEVLRNAPQ